MTDTAKASEAVPLDGTILSEPNKKAESAKLPPKNSQKTPTAGNDVRSLSGRIKSIRIVNAGGRIGEYQFNLTGKKGKSRPFALETSDYGRLTIFAGLLAVAQSTGAKVSVVSTLSTTGADYVTELEVKSKQ